MYEIRIHGLGGEGVVKLSDMIGKAATRDGKWAHSLPFFGTEVRGAAVKAFTRVSESPIHIKSYIYEPDVIIVTNDILLEDPQTMKGIKGSGTLLVNTARKKDQPDGPAQYSPLCINATDLAYEVLGRPIINTIMLGALIGVTGIISLETAIQIVEEEFSPKLARLNTMALVRGCEEVRREI